MEQLRTVACDGVEITYHLERKAVKNVNLRIRKDGKVFVSASEGVPAGEIDAFVCSKADFVQKALQRFGELERYAAPPKQYVSGETFYLLGRGLRLKVVQAAKESVISDGVYIYLNIQDPADTARKQRMVQRFLDAQCRIVFAEILEELYPIFHKYGVERPILRIRDMQTRWGSCLVKKGIVTLNKQLLAAPRNCIEYVVMHELCHFIHPNHSRQFYSFLTTLMPDWKERKTLLEKNAMR